MKLTLLLTLLLSSNIIHAQSDSANDPQTGCRLSLGFLQKNSFRSGEATGQLRQYLERKGAQVDKDVLAQLQAQADSASERASNAANSAFEYCISNK